MVEAEAESEREELRRLKTEREEMLARAEAERLKKEKEEAEMGATWGMGRQIIMMLKCTFHFIVQ